MTIAFESNGEMFDPLLAVLETEVPWQELDETKVMFPGRNKMIPCFHAEALNCSPTFTIKINQSWIGKYTMNIHGSVIRFYVCI